MAAKNENHDRGDVSEFRLGDFLSFWCKKLTFCCLEFRNSNFFSVIEVKSSVMLNYCSRFRKWMHSYKNEANAHLPNYKEIGALNVVWCAGDKQILDFENSAVWWCALGMPKNYEIWRCWEVLEIETFFEAIWLVEKPLYVKINPFVLRPEFSDIWHLILIWGYESSGRKMKDTPKHTKTWGRIFFFIKIEIETS